MKNEGHRFSLIYYANIAYELGKWAFAIIIIGTLIHFFLVTIFVISGPSMEVEFHSGEVVLVSRIGQFSGAYKRGDPMVIRFPGDPEHKKYIKRLIGLPGETITIKDNEILIDGKKLTETYIQLVPEEYLPGWYDTEELAEQAAAHAQGKAMTQPDMSVTLGPDDYFFMGDNRENSNDSRVWYPAKKSDIIGPVRFILYPFKYWGPVVNPYYGS